MLMYNIYIYMHRFGWDEKGYKNILHFNITFIIISASMETVSTDIACEEVSSEDADYNYGTVYNIHGVKNITHQKILEVFKHIKPTIRNVHKHIRIFIRHSNSCWEPKLCDLKVSDIFLDKIHEVKHNTYALKMNICLQATDTEKNDFYLVPEKLKNYIALLLTEEGWLNSSDVDVMIMARLEIPIETGEDEVDSELYSNTVDLSKIEI